MIKINLNDAVAYRIDGRHIWVQHSADHETWVTAPRSSRVTLLRQRSNRGVLYLGSASRTSMEVAGKHSELSVLAAAIHQQPAGHMTGSETGVT